MRTTGSHHTELLPGLLRTDQNRDLRSSRTFYWWATELGCDLACEHPVYTDNLCGEASAHTGPLYSKHHPTLLARVIK